MKDEKRLTPTSENKNKTIDIKDVLARRRTESKLDSPEEMDAMWDRSLEFFEESAKELAR
ncbi:MAG: hypothetical protein WC966_06930 [Bradymonadales bacterium]